MRIQKVNSRHRGPAQYLGTACNVLGSLLTAVSVYLAARRSYQFVVIAAQAGRSPCAAACPVPTSTSTFRTTSMTQTDSRRASTATQSTRSGPPRMVEWPPTTFPNPFPCSSSRVSAERILLRRGRFPRISVLRAERPRGAGACRCGDRPRPGRRDRLGRERPHPLTGGTSSSVASTDRGDPAW